MKHIDDSELGSLTLFDGTGMWERDFTFPNVSRCRLAIESEPSLDSAVETIGWSLPTPDQRQAFRSLTQNLPDIAAKCEAALAASYKRHKSASSVQILGGARDVLWTLVSTARILLPREFCDFSVVFSVAWESEHGHSVFFRDNQIVLIE